MIMAEPRDNGLSTSYLQECSAANRRRSCAALSDQPVGSPVPGPPWRVVRVCPRGGGSESLAVVPGRGCGTAWVRSVSVICISGNSI